MTDEAFIRRTFSLARLGLGSTWPNPMVGAVIVRDGRVLSEGWHRKAGDAHAELDAFQKAKTSLEGATLYVNLEPCCHTDKLTPPCAQRIIKEKIKKVVICNLDPNPAVNGGGIDLLTRAGIEVVTGVLAEEGERLNEVFFLSQRERRPFVHFKTASTLDGLTAMATGESQWITGEKARLRVHEIRSEQQAVLVGAETVRKDNPRLTVRLPDYSRPQPWRIVVTKTGHLPRQAHLFTDEFRERTLIYTASRLTIDFPAWQVIRLDSLPAMLEDLFERKIISVLLEAGGTLASEFLKHNFIDRISVFQNPSFLGRGKSIFSDFEPRSLNSRPRLSQLESHWLGDDHLITGRLSCSRD